MKNREFRRDFDKTHLLFLESDPNILHESVVTRYSIRRIVPCALPQNYQFQRTDLENSCTLDGALQLTERSGRPKSTRQVAHNCTKIKITDGWMKSRNEVRN